MDQKLSNIVSAFPGKPGVYQFINSQGDVIYVGKAKDLKNRVSSYFNRKSYESAKLRVLVSKVSDIKIIIVDSESDALLLENNLIKKLKPRYNILLKDDKTYPWICIKNEPFPRVFSTRNYIQDGSKYFGPYTSGVLMKTILDLVKSLYPLRNCNLSLTPKNISEGKFKPCLEYQLGNCLAPCVGNQTRADYEENIKSIVDILNGNIQSVRKLLAARMKESSSTYNFEEAQRYKEKILALDRFQAKSAIVSQSYKDIDVFSIVNEKNFACVNYIKVIKGSVIQSHNLELRKSLDESDTDLLGVAIAELRQRAGSKSKEIIVPFKPEFLFDGCKYSIATKGDKKKLLQLSERNAKAYVNEKLLSIEKKDPAKRTHRILSALQRDFKIKELPKHIECFDNSNLQGTNPVSACVVFRNGLPSKKEYRHFNIKTVEGPDDYSSMNEVIMRRYSRLIENNESLPQLIVVDGGKGQLNAAYTALKKLNIEDKVQIIGIAKRLEEIFFYGDLVPIYLDKNSESLKVIQHARNEAHRFGITHHRNKRSKSAVTSELMQIKGIGERTMQLLLKSFKSVDLLKKASQEEIEKIVGPHKARMVFDHFKNQT